MSCNWNERELEDYICQDISVIRNYVYGAPVALTLLGRQIPCRYGIIDILALLQSENTFSLLIIELKAATADDKTIGQVLRYQRAIQEVAIDVSMESPAWEYDTAPDPALLYDISNRVLTTIIAPRFKSDALESAKHMGWPVLAEKTDCGSFVFRTPKHRSVYPASDNSALRHALGPWISLGVEAEERRIAKLAEWTIQTEALSGVLSSKN